MSTKLREKQEKLFNDVRDDNIRENKVDLRNFLKKVEINLIIDSLNKENGNRRKAAETLGIKYTTLSEKIKRYKIDHIKIHIKIN